MLFREAIDRWQPDTEPLLLAQVLGNLATVAGPDEALAQYTRAAALVEKHGGPEHPLLAPSWRITSRTSSRSTSSPITENRLRDIASLVDWEAQIQLYGFQLGRLT
jgi:hypothetical protein